MLLWVALAVMTGAAVLFVLVPLSRRQAAAQPAASDLAVYRDQLDEIERDKERGLIGRAEAEAARVEIARRLLEADAAAKAAGAAALPRWSIPVASIAALIVLPGLALGLYVRYGSPDLPAQPLAARLMAPASEASLAELVTRVERHLAANPEDGEGWAVLAPVYLRSGRVNDARQAYGKALRLLGSTPDREADFGEAVVTDESGVVTAEAKAAFERAVAADPAHPKARYFLGLAAEQDGDKARALDIWRKLMAETAPASGTAAFLDGEIARVEGRAAPMPALPGPSAEDVQAAQSMSGGEQQVMIRGMVERLSTRLAAEGGSVDEWLRLVRAYAVLGEKDKAIAAAADARKALAGKPEEVKAIDDLAASLGLEG